MKVASNILICYQARGSAGFLDLLRFLKLIYMFTFKPLNIYILSRKSVSLKLLNLEYNKPYINVVNISSLRALGIKTNITIFIMPNFLDSLILFFRKAFMRDFYSQFVVIHNPPLQLSSKNQFINIIGIILQLIFYLFSDINIYLSEFVSSKWFNYKKSIVQVLPDLGSTQSFKDNANLNQIIKPKTIKLLVIGRWLPYKSLGLLVGALNKIRNSDLNNQILISIQGSSYPQEEILALSNSILNKNVHVEYNDYYIPDSDVDKTLLSSDFCLFLYLKASQSGFMQRCKELSVPVICTKVGGLEEYLKNGGIGYAVQPDFDSIKNIISEISKNNNLTYQYKGNVAQGIPLINYLKANNLRGLI